MNKKIGVVALLAVLALSAPRAAAAQSLEMMQLVSNLGTVIAAEEFCGLSYDQAAIEAFIEERVPADDLSFAPQLNSSVMGHGFQQDSMSQSAKTAHCAQIRRVAKSYGFIS